ncbi:hypothetical protein [Hydrocarboniphaga sp.]|uniref:hypothetical protein n=1 Tax=Hydrocarboniphaga sp. TaxID=2033016 RepID=UPI003D0ED41F
MDFYLKFPSVGVMWSALASVGLATTDGDGAPIDSSAPGRQVLAPVPGCVDPCANVRLSDGEDLPDELLPFEIVPPPATPAVVWF